MADEVDLQATLDFIYNLSTDVHGTTELPQLIDGKGVLNFEDDLDETSEDDVSINECMVEVPFIGKGAKVSPCASQSDVDSLVESAPWPEVSTQPTKRRRRGIPRKDEIAELKKLAAKLTKKLEGMKASAAKVEELSKSRKGNTLDKKLWKDVASRQLALRRETEAQNVKLRDEVILQAKYAANLKRMLKRRYCEEMLEMMPISKRGRSAVANTCVDNERVFTELLEGTDHIYSSVDALFAKKDMAKLPCPGRTRLTFPEVVNGMFIELVDKTQVPFNSQMTANAVWKALNGRKTRDGDIVEAKLCIQNTQQFESVFKSYLSYTCNAAGHSSFVQESRVGRKYIEDDRVVFICRGVAEPRTRSLTSLGLLFQETVVMVVRKGQALASGQETAVIESYLWITRCDDNKEAALKFRDTVFVDIAIKGWNKKLSLYSERIENILFDDHLSQSQQTTT
ncbi:Hypothetical protein PHPALM_13952 [Phytophthora palmivora]|uniref:M96 mating-specific protein family n=1 Tax=Phytophthora palmivora TaxID=4796 RepID=A0A2P4XVZ5_9STRA|nr:Hypothetical protein PHPALM_13952 [Phytophthora palmivora]